MMMSLHVSLLPTAAAPYHAHAPATHAQAWLPCANRAWCVACRGCAPRALQMESWHRLDTLSIDASVTVVCHTLQQRHVTRCGGGCRSPLHGAFPKGEHHSAATVCFPRHAPSVAAARQLFSTRQLPHWALSLCPHSTPSFLPPVRQLSSHCSAPPSCPLPSVPPTPLPFSQQAQYHQRLSPPSVYTAAFTMAAAGGGGSGSGGGGGGGGARGAATATVPGRAVGAVDTSSPSPHGEEVSASPLLRSTPKASTTR